MGMTDTRAPTRSGSFDLIYSILQEALHLKRLHAEREADILNEKSKEPSHVTEDIRTVA